MNTIQDKTDPNFMARKEIAKMPPLAGKCPRNAFLPNVVVMADLKGRGFKEPFTPPIRQDLLASLTLRGPDGR